VRMLWYRAWLETRTRWLCAAVAVAAVCAFFVAAHPWVLRQWARDAVEHPEWRDPAWLHRASRDYPFFLWHFLFADLLQKVWTIAVVLLGAGGLTREAAMGTAGFTLSLPVSRRALFGVRAAVGVIEGAALGVVGALTIVLTSLATGQPYPPVHAFAHAGVMAIGGMVFLAFSLLLSTLVEGEHTATLWGLAAVGLMYFAVAPHADGAPAPLVVRLVDVGGVMAGSPDGAPSWTGLAMCSAVAALALWAAMRSTAARDF
jgi:ABC-2 type transport system permease protein